MLVGENYSAAGGEDMLVGEKQYHLCTRGVCPPCTRMVFLK